MSRFTKTILFITVLTGVLDITAAWIHIYINTGKFADWIFKAIAGGLLTRPRAMAGGWETSLLGIFCHFFVCFAFTRFYFLIYPRMPILWKNKFISGIVYGLFIWAMMNLVVVPLSALPPTTIQFPGAIVGLIVIPTVVGLPIALAAAWYYGRLTPQATLV